MAVDADGGGGRCACGDRLYAAHKRVIGLRH
jgi:hypothetical protein